MRIERSVDGAEVRFREDIREPNDPEWTAALIKRRREGASLRAIGAEFGCAHQTASNIIARWGDWYDLRRKLR
jgi:hypothetical protein